MKHIFTYLLAFFMLFLTSGHSFAYGDSAGNTVSQSSFSNQKLHQAAKKIEKHHRHSTKIKMSDLNLSEDDFQFADPLTVSFVATAIFAITAFFLSEVRGNAPNFAEIYLPEKTRRFILLRNLRI